MDSRIANLDLDKLIERVSLELMKRFERGTSLPKMPNGIGPPFCAACPVQGSCVKTCPDHTSAVADHGAARVSHAPGMGSLEQKIAAAIDHTLLLPQATK